MKTVGLLCAILVPLALTGCGTFHGSKRIIDSSGQPLPEINGNWPVANGQPPTVAALDRCKAIYSPVDRSGSNGDKTMTGAADECGIILNFILSYHAAEADAAKISAGLMDPDAGVSRRARQTAIDGATVIQSYCKSFFEQGGDSQKWIAVAKDILTESGSLAAGVLSIASPANATASAVLSLSTSTSSHALDIYTRNFLFGSDNIQVVRNLTISKLDENETKFELDIDTTPTKPWDFRKAKNFLEEEQNICSPAHIRADVLDAIKDQSKPAHS